MDQDKVLQTVDDQLNFLDRMSALHQKRMVDSIATLEKRIVDRLTILQTDDKGSLIGPKTNLVQAQKVHSDLTQLFDEEYGDASRTTVKEYSESLPIIEQQYKDLETAAKFTGLDKKMIDTLKTRDLAEYAGFGLQTQDKIAAALYDHVVAQSPFSSLVTAIAGALTGHTDARGKPMANYAKQMANDGIMNFHNAVNLKKADDLKFTHFLYVGNIIADSRDFCVKRAGNVYTREQIDSWTGPWQGKSGPAFTHRGGYNCRHHWQPVRKEWIPEGGIEVQSSFDRAGVMPVSKLPAAVTANPKFKAYQIYQKGLLVDRKSPTVSEIVKQTGGNKAATTAWLSHWEKGFDLPQGWQSVVRDLEAKVGGFARAVPGPPLPVAPVIEEIIEKAIATKTAEKAAIAIQEATKDALTIAKEEIKTTAEEYKQLYSKLTGKDLSSISAPDLYELAYQDAGGYNKWGFIDNPKRQAILKKVTPIFKELEANFGNIQSKALSILELEKNPVFESFTDVMKAKTFYEDSINRLNAFENYFSQFGFRKGQFVRGIEPLYAEATKGFVGDPSIAQKVRKAFYSQLFEHTKLVKRTRYQWLNLADEATYITERRKITEALTEFIDDANTPIPTATKVRYLARTSAGLDYVPIDLLESMYDEGYSLKIYASKDRAFYSDLDRSAKVFIGAKDDASMIAHEWGHAIDGFFNGEGYTGRNWTSPGFESYVTAKDGENYRSWFKAKTSTKKGKFGNKDGFFFENNWISDYEGRIYPGGSMGEEWWAMNIQRYSSYYLSKKSDQMVALLDAGKISKAEVGDFFDLVVSGKSSVMVNQWERAKKMYPELTNFMDSIFGKRTMLYNDVKESWIDAAQAKLPSVKAGIVSEDVAIATLKGVPWNSKASDMANLKFIFKFHTPDKTTISPMDFIERVRKEFALPDLMKGQIGRLDGWMKTWRVK